MNKQKTRYNIDSSKERRFKNVSNDWLDVIEKVTAIILNVIGVLAGIKALKK